MWENCRAVAPNEVSYLTEPGHVSRNKMDMHANSTCCAGANWAIMDLTGDVYEVTPFIGFIQTCN
jgi:hypothetical protein